MTELDRRISHFLLSKFSSLIYLFSLKDYCIQVSYNDTMLANFIEGVMVMCTIEDIVGFLVKEAS